MATTAEDRLLAEAKELLKRITAFGDKLPADVGPAKVEKVVGDMAVLVQTGKDLDEKRLALTNDKRAKTRELREIMKRVKSSVAGVFGDDSNEYELVGGTRRSERKKPVRKPKVPA